MNNRFIHNRFINGFPIEHACVLQAGPLRQVPVDLLTVCPQLHVQGVVSTVRCLLCTKQAFFRAFFSPRREKTQDNLIFSSELHPTFLLEDLTFHSCPCVDQHFRFGHTHPQFAIQNQLEPLLQPITSTEDGNMQFNSISGLVFICVSLLTCSRFILSCPSGWQCNRGLDV